MVLKIYVALVWTIVFAVFYSHRWAQRNHDLRWSREANKRLVNYLKVALVFIMPELLALLLFVLPWVRNFAEKSNWRIFHVLTWWFQTQQFVSCGLREGLFHNISYAMFWVGLLLANFSFHYFFQMKPMISPTKEILNIEKIPYKWHVLFSHSNQISMGLMWAPAILVYFMDT